MACRSAVVHRGALTSRSAAPALRPPHPRRTLPVVARIRRGRPHRWRAPARLGQMGMSKIIVGVEGEREGRDAVALGAALARALDASLILCGVSSELFAPAAYGHELAARPIVEDRLAAAAALVPDDVAHEVHVVASTSAVRGL